MRILLPSLPVFALALCLTGQVFAADFTPQDDLIGELDHARLGHNQSLTDFAHEHDIGYSELLAANPDLNPKKLKAGIRLALKTQYILPDVREGIVLNLAEQRLYYFAPEGEVFTYPTAIGKKDWETPTGKTRIARKRKDPIWTPPDSIREENPELPDFIPAGPDNPLGLYAMNLAWPGYIIHGTNHPESIGRRASHGCVRLYAEDIEALFTMAEIGTPVTVIDTPYKLGWHKGTLYLQVTPTQTQTDALVAGRGLKPAPMPALYQALQAIESETEINWYAVDDAVQEFTGLPVEIGKKKE